MDKTLLQQKMVEKSITAEGLAKAINIGRATFFRKLRDGGDTFTIKEVEDICRILNLTRSEIHAIFFNPSVSHMRHQERKPYEKAKTKQKPCGLRC